MTEDRAAYGRYQHDQAEGENAARAQAEGAAAADQAEAENRDAEAEDQGVLAGIARLEAQLCEAIEQDIEQLIGDPEAYSVKATVVEIVRKVRVAAADQRQLYGGA